MTRRTDAKLPGIQGCQFKEADHLPMADKCHPVAGHLDLAQEVRVQEHASPLQAQFVDDIAHQDAPHRVEAGSGFIQENQGGLVEKGLRQPDTLQHPLGEGRQVPVAETVQSHPLEQFVDPGPLDPGCRIPKS